MNNYPRSLIVSGKNYSVEYNIVGSKTSSVRMKKGKVVLRLSRFVRGRELDNMIEKFLDWAEKRLKRVVESELVASNYEDGGRVCVHNKVYEVRVCHSARSSCRCVLDENGVIEVDIPLDCVGVEKNNKVRDLVERKIIHDQSRYLKEVLDELNQLYFQEDFNICRFKRTTSRFGSCSSKRNINISYRLLFAPREVFRYVCIHELAHLKEFNHSKRFWALVEAAMPGYRECEKWLSNNGFLLG